MLLTVADASDLKVDQFGQTKHRGGTFHKVPSPFFLSNIALQIESSWTYR